MTVIVPARNEERALPGCLASLITQSEPGFALGREWELIVVDDHSSDRTQEIARHAAQQEGVHFLSAPAFDTGPKAGFNGKTNACWAGAQAAHGDMILFTDADTVHEPGSLSRARYEMEKYNASLLSYSPRQLVSGFAQRTLMPLIFAELAVAYPSKRVNLLEDRTAAANGQYLLVEQEAYFAIGGHRAVGREVLEDVALARNMKRSRRPIRFRYAPDAVSAHMYRDTHAMIEGWTKNLALLFASPLLLAAIRSLVFLLIVGIPVVALIYPFLTSLQRLLLALVWLRGVWFFYARVAKSNFAATECALSVLGIPLFVYLLVRSYLHIKIRRSIRWKGRSYPTTSH